MKIEIGPYVTKATNDNGQSVIRLTERLYHGDTRTPRTPNQIMKEVILANQGKPGEDHDQKEE